MCETGLTLGVRAHARDGNFVVAQIQLAYYTRRFSRRQIAYTLIKNERANNLHNLHLYLGPGH